MNWMPVIITWLVSNGNSLPIPSATFELVPAIVWLAVYVIGSFPAPALEWIAGPLGIQTKRRTNCQRSAPADAAKSE